MAVDETYLVLKPEELPFWEIDDPDVYPIPIMGFRRTPQEFLGYVRTRQAEWPDGVAISGGSTIAEARILQREAGIRWLREQWGRMEAECMSIRTGALEAPTGGEG